MCKLPPAKAGGLVDYAPLINNTIIMDLRGERYGIDYTPDQIITSTKKVFNLMKKKIKSWLKNRAFNSNSIVPLVILASGSSLLRTVKNMIQVFSCTNSRPLSRRRFVVLEADKVVYLTTPKNAGSSIKKSLLAKVANQGAINNVIDDNTIHRNVPWTVNLTKEEMNYFKFTFVRNPFERLVSLYVDKFSKGKSIFIYNYLNGIFKPSMTFSEVIKIIAKIPDRLANRHFKSQYSIIYEKDQCLVDFTGRFENLEADFEPIRKKYQLDPLPYFNRSPKYDYREFYTTELVELVAARYQRDIEVFGYEEEYQALLDYCQNQQKDTKEKVKNSNETPS
jgi:hypothetical protein